MTCYEVRCQGLAKPRLVDDKSINPLNTVISDPESRPPCKDIHPTYEHSNDINKTREEIFPGITLRTGSADHAENNPPKKSGYVF